MTTMLKDCLRKARDIVFNAVTGISDTNVQDAIETAYEKGDEALTVANSKISQSEADARYLGINAKAVDSDKLDGLQSTDYIETDNISTAVDSASTTTVSASAATKTSYDHAEEAHSLIASKDTEYYAAFEQLTRRNQVNGYAGLDSAGLLSPNQIPGAPIVNVYTYASTEERNAFTGHHQGDMAIIEVVVAHASNEANLYILKNDPAGSATIDDDWLVLQTNVTIDVHSWNSRNGDVMPTMGDYTSELVLHNSGRLDTYLQSLEDSIPENAGDLDAYTKAESDGRFINLNAISSDVDSGSTSNVSNSLATKTAYDHATDALNTANSKLDETTADTLYLGISAKATDSDKLDGKNSSAFLLTTGTAANSLLLENNNATYYRNASNLNAGVVANARLPATATRSDNDIKDIAGILSGGSQTRMSCTYNSTSKTYTFNAHVQSDNNFTDSYQAKLDNLLPNHWQVIDTNTTVNAGERVMVDMELVGTLLVNLPGSPSAGDTVMIGDGTGLAGSGKSLTIGRNGHPIMSLDEDMNVDIPGYLMTFVFLNDTRGWVVMN